MATILVVMDFEKVTDGPTVGLQLVTPPLSSEYLPVTQDAHTVGVFACYMTDESVAQFLQFELGIILDDAVTAHGVGYP